MEDRNQNTLDIDELSTLDVLKKINEEDKKIADIIEKQLPDIEKVINQVVDCLNNGGRIFYIGSGTSGKLGVLDASECPPTFGVDDEFVQAVISGGEKAVSGWLEGTEDNEELAVKDLQIRKISKKDLLIGLTASGNTPYVLSAMRYGSEIGCKTVGILCRSAGNINAICEEVISIDVGPEVIMGSTRMKAGTAQKMVLNMISTTAMIKLGKTYSNLMVNVRPINQKLRNRVKEIVRLATDLKEHKVEEVLASCNYEPKTAIVSIKLGLNVNASRELLQKHNWNVSVALKAGASGE